MFSCNLKIRDNMAKYLGINEAEDEKIYQTNLVLEKTEWRKKLRMLKYLLKPMEKREHMSISSQPMDDELVLFSENCKGEAFFI